MADTKISALPASTTPLAGTETLPIVQGGVTKKVSVADLTAGRAVGMAGGSFSDNLIQGTAAKGINFTANTSAAGMTSQLLNWYEEGTFTPTMTSATGVITVNSSSGSYTRIGNIVSFRLSVTFNSDASVGTSNITIGGLPYACNSTYVEKAFLSYSNTTSTDYGDGFQQIFNSATSINWAFRTNSLSSRTNSNLMFVASYRV